MGTLSSKGWCTMENEKQKIATFSTNQEEKNTYDDGNIPKEDLPRNVTPDEVPRKDGPGGEGQKS